MGPAERLRALRYAAGRVAGIVRPPVTVTPTPPDLVVERDVPVAMRDGVTLRVNVFRPPGPGPFPVLMSAHPYGKDALPRRRRRGYRLSFQYRALRQTARIRFSELTSWEAPDPVWWAGHGYAVVNADLRGCGTSDGVGRLLSRREGEDYHDLIEWAASRPWSTGRVGLAGVSYLALSQYRAAEARPPSLAAICPWEGFTDAYADLMRPGGIREMGFLRLWSRGVRSDRLDEDAMAEQARRPLRDGWWASLVPDLARIEVPMLVCGSFSDNCLHTRGSFRAFMDAGAADRFLYTHRTGKWAAFYGDDARAAQLAFFERFLRATPGVPAPPRVRLEVRSGRDAVHAVRSEAEWPLARTRWTALHLDAASGSLGEAAPDAAASVIFDSRAGRAVFSHRLEADTELTGPMALRLHVEGRDCADVHLFAGVELWRGRRMIRFEGSYGYGRDRVTTGWMRAALSLPDPERSRPGMPAHGFDHERPLVPGGIVAVDIPLGPSATFMRAGDELRLVVSGRWPSPRNPLTGQFPARYESSPPGTCVLHTGGPYDAHLLVPVIPPG